MWKSRFRLRGSVDSGPSQFLFYILFGVIVWGLIECALGYYKASTMEHSVESIVLANKDQTDEILKGKIRENFHSQYQVDVNDGDLALLRSEDGKSLNFKMTYSYPIQIPIWGESIHIPFHLDIDEDMSPGKSLLQLKTN